MTFALNNVDALECNLIECQAHKIVISVQTPFMLTYTALNILVLKAKLSG